MKFCGQCGAQLEDDAVFCGTCGAKVEAEQPEAEQTAANVSSADTAAQSNYVQNNGQNMNGAVNSAQNMQNGQQGQPVQAAPKKTFTKQQKMIAGIAAAAVVVIIAAVLIVTNILKKRVDVNKYLSVKFDGYNTAGTASIDVDEDGLYKAILKAKGYSEKEIEEAEDDYSTYYTLLKLVSNVDIDYELDKESELSNGDKVKMTVTCDKDKAKEIGLTFVCSDKEYTVADLQEPKTINPFDYAEVSFSGTSPNASVSIKNNASSSEESFVRNLSFKAENTRNIKKGDDVTVTISTDEKTALKKGYKFTETSKTYKCDKVDLYVTKAEELTDAQLKELQEKVTTKIKSDIEKLSSYDVKCGDLTYEGSYILSSKSSTSSSGHVVYLVYSGKVEGTGKTGFEETKVYFPVQLSGVIVKAAGELKYSTSMSIKGSTSLKYNSFSSVSGYTDGEKMYKDIIDANKSGSDYEVKGNITSFGK